MSEFEYLVTYGRGAYLGRFRAAAIYRRDDRVVVRSDRGVELGTVRERATNSAVFAAGDILRPTTADDEAAAAQQQERVVPILADAERAAGARGLPLLFLDGEVLLDGSQAIL